MAHDILIIYGEDDLGVLEISPAEFDSLAESERKLQAGTTSFNFDTSEGRSMVTWHSLGAKVVGLSFAVPEGITTVGDHVAYNGGSPDVHCAVEYVYPAAKMMEIQDHMYRKRETGDPPPLKAKCLPYHLRNPIPTDIDGAAELIRETDPEKILFYTGAGTSGGGEYPIRDYRSFTRDSGFTPLDQPVLDIPSNDRFVEQVLTQPDKARSLMDTYQGMLDVIFLDSTTPAHVALAGIARNLELKPSFLTTNYDLKHESTGSGLRVPKIVPSWHDDRWDDISPERDKRRRRSKESIEQIQDKGVDLLVAIGADADRRGVIAELDAPTVLAINTAQYRWLPYVATKDYYLQEDIQKALPGLARRLRQD